MKLIDVLNKQCNGEIRKGTKLIVDFSYKQDSPETYIYDGERFDDYQWLEEYGASTEILNTEVKLIEPQLYYCKMPNSERVLGILGEERKLVFEPIVTYQSWNITELYLFSRDEIDSMDILAPYRNFEWSEYNEID
ncbi:hypothetical protein [Enterococcus cecorum]|uniref:hypothetical protein n=1 Tax=Enterococcus cecorum TaxID=44008 RepID=UPI00148E7669|nr:hypothetical protein [Enterococcus cecorum]